MLLGQGILTGGIKKHTPGGVLIFRDHFLAAAAVSGEGVTTQQGIRRKDPVINEGPDQCNKSAGMAAGNRNAFGGDDFLKECRGKFRETICPLIVGAVRRGGIQHHYIRIFDHGDCFPGGIIRQTEKCDIAGVEHLPAPWRIFAVFFGKKHQFDVFALLEPLIDPKTGSPGLPVNKYFCCHFFHLLLN